jgi:hypothetical protein
LIFKTLCKMRIPFTKLPKGVVWSPPEVKMFY